MEDKLIAGGLFDSLLKMLLKDASFDYKKLLKHPELKKALHSFATALKDSATLPLNLDDKVIDQAVVALEALLDAVQSKPVVGGRAYTKADATAFIGGLGGSIPAECAAKIEQYPAIVEALEHLSPEKRLKAASDPTILDRLVTILLEWGPLFLKIAMFILPFLI